MAVTTTTTSRTGGGAAAASCASDEFVVKREGLPRLFLSLHGNNYRVCTGASRRRLHVRGLSTTIPVADRAHALALLRQAAISYTRGNKTVHFDFYPHRVDSISELVGWFHALPPGSERAPAIELIKAIIRSFDPASVVTTQAQSLEILVDQISEILPLAGCDEEISQLVLEKLSVTTAYDRANQLLQRSFARALQLSPPFSGNKIWDWVKKASGRLGSLLLDDRGVDRTPNRANRIFPELLTEFELLNATLLKLVEHEVRSVPRDVKEGILKLLTQVKKQIPAYREEKPTIHGLKAFFQSKKQIADSDDIRYVSVYYQIELALQCLARLSDDEAR